MSRSLVLFAALAAMFLVAHNPAQVADKPVYDLPDMVANYEPVPVEIEEIKETMMFEATAYCYGNVTSTGTSPIAYRTAAVDPKVIPYGTEFTLDAFPGVIWIAEDCGNSCSDQVSRSGYYAHVRGNRIDLRLSSQQECLEFGRREVRLEVIE